MLDERPRRKWRGADSRKKADAEQIVAMIGLLQKLAVWLEVQ